MTDAATTPAHAADDARTEIVQAIPAVAQAEVHAAHPETLFGRPIPFAAYTAIYAILAVTSLIEVALAEILPFDSWIRVPLLGGLSIMKAVLVMAYYMHLKDDSRIFAAAIILPIVVSLVATLFLLGVPSGY